MHYHGSNFTTLISNRNFIVRRFFIHIMNSCDTVIVLGTKTFSEFTEIGIHEDKLTIMRMGVPDLQQTVENIELSISKRRKAHPTILFAGELGARKGLLETLQSLSDQKLQAVKLIVAGSGDLERWKQIATELGVQNRVAFVGLRRYSEIHQFFGIADALILASKAEGLPVSVMECFSAGKIPIINLSGNLEDVATESNAILMTKPIKSDIVRSLDRFNTLFRSQKYDEFSQNSRETWEKFFNVEETTMVLTQLWANIASQDEIHEA